ncbi:hypothetical protein AXF42_Ash015062 [Apostasia shenzhenica]|uniref:Uncharacterized protein n=1 Tax=Apostasia shenzhenica TaxID=1088818 RepID=A0A2I0B2Z9_9ASPA|nr:hypothetical protein AXF42_Ash015062 [Apostasia shenzhenica]
MAGMQLASFFIEVARNSRRPPKACFFEIAPWRATATICKQHERPILDPIVEEDGPDIIENRMSVIESVFTTSSAMVA